MDEVSPFEPTVVTAVKRHWRLVIVCILVCTIAAALYGFTRPATYTATASLTVGDPRGPGVLAGQSTEPPDRYVADQVPVFSSLSLAERASATREAADAGVQAAPGVVPFACLGVLHRTGQQPSVGVVQRADRFPGDGRIAGDRRGLQRRDEELDGVAGASGRGADRRRYRLGQCSR